MKARNPLLVVLWTFALFVLGNTVLYPHFFISAAWLGVGVDSVASGATQTPETILVKGLCGLVLGLPLTWVIVRYLWRRDMTWMGFRFSGRAFGGGALVGLALGCLAVGLLLVCGVGRVTAGPARFTPSELSQILVGLVAWTAFSTLLEETVFRGMATREFALKWGWPAAMVVGGAFFAACHMPGMLPLIGWPLALGLLAGGIVVSVLFTALYLRGGSLSLPWGVHFGWNLALTAVLGTVMSGEDRSFGLWHVEVAGQPLLTGGAFGPELSVVALGIMAVAAVVVLRVRRPR